MIELYFTDLPETVIEAKNSIFILALVLLTIPLKALKLCLVLVEIGLFKVFRIQLAY